MKIVPFLSVLAFFTVAVSEEKGTVEIPLSTWEHMVDAVDSSKRMARADQGYCPIGRAIEGDFHRGMFNSHSFLAWLAWYGPTKVLQKLVLRTPLVILPTLIGEIEQDFLYWPLKYRGIAAQWRKETEWGKLFREYREKGHCGG
jgi:hypothetical protein